MGVGARTFPSAFLGKTRMEGWGLTKAGWYLGYYGSKWRRSPVPLDARGKPLTETMVAVAPEVPLGTRVTLPGSPAPWGTMRFTATDHGGRIGSNHVDVYTGLGRSAELATYRVTRASGRVCLGDSSR